MSTTHGFCYHPCYIVWKSMKHRCYNTKYAGYKDYGGRGIDVCAEWKNNPRAFVEWAIANGWQKGLEIDRIDNDKGYSPNNCRFATKSEQRLNTRLLGPTNTSGFRGVSRHKQNGKYRVDVGIDGNKYRLGLFKTAIEAAKARDAFVVERGIHTPLNFP